MLVFTLIASLVAASAYIIYEAQHIIEVQDLDNFFEGWTPPPQIEVKPLPNYGLWYEDAIKKGLIEGKNEKQRAVKAFLTYRDTYQPYFLLEEESGISFKNVYDKEVNRFIETIRLYKGYDTSFVRYFHAPLSAELSEVKQPEYLSKEWKDWEERGFTYKSKLSNKTISGKHYFSSFGYAKELDYRLSQGACKKCLLAESRLISPMLGVNEIPPPTPQEINAFISHKVLKHWWNLVTK